MAKLTLEIITGEQLLLREEEIDEVVAPGSLGELGILPSHAPLVTSLQAGSLRVKRAGDEDDFFVSGGFLEIRDNHVKVLADAAERGAEIDLDGGPRAGRGRAAALAHAPQGGPPPAPRPGRHALRLGRGGVATRSSAGGAILTVVV